MPIKTKKRRKRQKPRTGRYCGDCDQIEYIDCPHCGCHITCMEYDDEELETTKCPYRKIRLKECIKDGPGGKYKDG